MSLKFEVLQLRYQHRNETKVNALKIVGVDTETDYKHGRVELICDDTGRALAYPESFEEIAEWLFYKPNRGSLYTFYNLKYDAQAILKWTPPEIWSELWEKGESIYNEYKITLIPWKLFSISKGHKTVKCMDISQFYGMRLKDAANKYLTAPKIDLDVTKIDDFGNDKVIEYCVRDAALAGELSRYLLDMHSEKIGDVQPSLISKAAMSEKYFSARCNIPTINNLIRKHPDWIKYGYESYNGGMFQAYQRGYFPKSCLYDINSAYPAAMADLPDISQGRFVCTGFVPYGARLGYEHCTVDINPRTRFAHISPISLQHNGTMYYPSGRFETYLTLAERQRYQEYCDINVKSGVYWIPDNLEYPFRDAINHLYAWKKTETDPVMRSLVKIILNSIYGKTIQKTPLLEPPGPESENDKKAVAKYTRWEELQKLGVTHYTGNLFNPFYAAYITAGCRLKLFDALMSCPIEDILMVATDSVLLAREPEYFDHKFSLSDNLGDWSLEKSGESVVIGSGVYSMRDEDGDVKSRIRGFKSLSETDFFKIGTMRHIDRRLLFEVMDHISLAKALISRDYESMNLLQRRDKELDINFDNRRFWTDRFSNPRDVMQRKISSMPIPADLIKSI